MVVTLYWVDGGCSQFASVQGVRVAAPGVVELQLWGNQPALNRGVARFAIDPFDFADSSECHCTTFRDATCPTHGDDATKAAR